MINFYFILYIFFQGLLRFLVFFFKLFCSVIFKTQARVNLVFVICLLLFVAVFCLVVVVFKSKHLNDWNSIYEQILWSC